MKKRLAPFICFLCLCCFTAAFAQNPGTVVQGRVLDTDKKPVSGVSVTEVDAENRTIRSAKTDVDGNFSLKINDPMHRLNFSHISFRSTDLPIGGRTTFNVTLQDNQKDLTGVVIVSQRRVD